MPMWAHYANNHSGFCVAYDTTIDENKKLYSNMMRVQYVKERIDVTDIFSEYMMKIEDLIKKGLSNGKKVILLKDFTLLYIITFLYCLKHESWSYEKELKCIIHHNAKGVPYIDGRPKSIYVGKNCTKENRKRLIDIAGFMGTPIYDMKFGEYIKDYKYKPKIIK